MNESDSTSGGGVVVDVVLLEAETSVDPDISFVLVVVTDEEDLELSSTEHVDERREIVSLMGSSASIEEGMGRDGATLVGVLGPQPI